MGWVHTIKFKIVALAVVTGVLSAVATAELLRRASHADILQLLLDTGAGSAQGTAALMASRLDLLQGTLTAVTRATAPGLWRDPEALSRHLQDKAALHFLFDVVLAADAQGSLLVRIVRGKPSAELPDIGDRPYFRQAIGSDQLVMSDPVVGRANRVPQVVMAMAAPTQNGQAAPGIIAGALALQSSGLFADLSRVGERDGSRTMVMNRSGVLLSHPDSARVMGSAADEPGLSAAYRRWRDSGSPIDTEGSVSLSGDHLIAMAGIAGSDWTLVHMTPNAVALRPLRQAQAAAWKSTAGVGFASALLAGLVGWSMTRPITRLRSRAIALLHEGTEPTLPWPPERGELGDLSRAFRQVEELRGQRQAETRALLRQLEAVLDHAQVGIALTRNSRFELVSHHFCVTLGVDKRELEGQPTRVMYNSDEAYAQLAERARPQFMEKGFFDGEVELRRKSGEPFWAHMRGRAVVPGDLAQGTIWTVEDVTDARTHREKLTWSASHDALTALANRTAFDSLLVQATAQAQVSPFCALFIDLDHFKRVNDTAGHAAGDALLRDIAQTLVAQVRKSDTVARLGGDEFAVLLDACPPHQAREIADKIRQAIVDYRLVRDGAAFSVGASIGLVHVDASFASAADVLAAADAACYAAKHQGRNCVVEHGDGVRSCLLPPLVP